MKIIEVVGGIIENSRGEILCTLRPENKKFGNMWEFPGGKVEKNEMEEEALKRELFEELNVEIENIKFFSKSVKEYGEFTVSLSCYKCKLKDESKLKLLEHRAFLWLEKKNLNSLVWVPTDIPIVEELISNIEEN